MPAPIVNGQKAAFLQKPKYGRNESGDYTLFTYEGTKAELQALVPAIVGAGGMWEMEESFTGVGSKLTARFSTNVGAGGGTEVPTNTWEFFANRVEKDLLESDLASVATISKAEKAVIKGAIANNENPSLAGAAGTIFDLEQIGVRARIQFAPILKNTKSVSTAYAVKASLTNVGKIISPTSIGTLESIPNTVLFNLPNDVWSGTGVIPAPTPTMAYGWLKFHPTIQVAAYQKTQIVQEWVYGLWSTFLYGAPI